MSNPFVQALTAATSQALTENGAVARGTTGSRVLDLFSTIGGMRGQADRAAGLAQVAATEDAQLTARLMFYARDVRGGQGEREIFRQCMKSLIKRDERFKSLIKHVPEYGRWDDVVELFGVAPYEVMDVIRTQLSMDLETDRPSLLAKWLPSEVTSSKATRAAARLIREQLDMTPRAYRKMLSALRKQIWLVEHAMTTGDWSTIPFERVPSRAAMIYRNAFKAHAPGEYAAYLAAVEKGEAKINAGTLFPYELVEKCQGWHVGVDATIEAQWKALPDYFAGKTENSLVVADVSGSMSGQPMQVAISLALYVAERNKGTWHNKFMTFSETPQIQNVEGDTLHARVKNLEHAEWGMNTNIERMFMQILATARATNTAPADMITRLYIVSDMEFDAATRGHGVNETLFQGIKRTFNQAGYEMPELVFWNVRAGNKQFPMGLDERGFLNVSGCSPSIFTTLLSGKFTSAHDLMCEVLNGERYARIVL